MLNIETYRLTLEDYSYPRHASVVRRYYGEMEDVEELMEGLRSHIWTQTRYQESLQAFDSYELDDTLTHTAAGTEFRFLVPITPLAAQDTVLEKQKWNYTGYSGAVYPMYADRIHVSQLLLRDEDDMIYRCVKADFEELHICAPAMGWYKPGPCIKGFPGMVKFEDNLHRMQMYVEEACYEFDDLITALEDLHRVEKIDLAEACRDIIGQA